MEYLRGEKLVDALKKQFTKMAAERGLTLKELQAEFKRKIEVLCSS